MLAVVVRLEGTLACAGVASGEALAALRALLGYGLPVLIASDDDAPLEPALAGALGAAERVSPATLGAPPFTPAGLRAIADRVQLPNRRIYAVSADERDVAAATLAGMPTLHVGGDAASPRTAKDLADAVARLREPYGRAALELREVFESFHARRRARRAAE